MNGNEDGEDSCARSGVLRSDHHRNLSSRRRCEKGKTLFNDPKFAGGSKACNDCHRGGKGLRKACDKREFPVMGKTRKSIEEAANACIVSAGKGKEIDGKSKAMADSVEHIKSLKAALSACVFLLPGIALFPLNKRICLTVRAGSSRCLRYRMPILLRLFL